MESSFTFLKVKGIEIGAHWSWLLVFGLIVFSLTSAFFPQAYPGLSDTTYQVMGVVTAVLFFGSLLLHELGHAFRAIKEGMQIDGITLWLFGGVARFKGMFPSAGAEFRIAIAGPVVSLLLAVVFWGGALAAEAANAPEAVQGILDYLARINAILLAFNLVPALPLDGGRVLRSWLWHRQKNFTAATHSAARAGKMFGAMLAIVGLLNFFTGGTTGGLWLVFLGWFLVQAAQGEAGMVIVHKALHGRRLRDLMSARPDTVDADATVAQLIDLAMGQRGHSTYPVVEYGGRALGLVSLRSAGSVPFEERDRTLVREIMVLRDQATVLDPDRDVLDVLDELQDGQRRALVEENGELIGILSISDVSRALKIEEETGGRPETAPRRAGILVWVLVGALMLLAAGALYHPPVVVVVPGETLDVGGDISISGIEVDELNGTYMLTSVMLEQPNALGVAWAALRPGTEIVPIDAVLPPGVDPNEFARQQREIFDQSRLLAAAAGAQIAGLEVDIKGDGARVEDVVPDSPAAGVLETGDVILAINDREIQTTADVRAIIGSRPAGSTFELRIDREGTTQEVEIRSERLPEVLNGNAGIGVFLSTRNFSVGLPFDIDFEERDVGGPSAGLAYGLAIADLLDDGDYAQGRTIVATGEITADGSVRPVGGVAGKAVAAEDAGADVFFVPSQQVDEAGDRVDLTIGVSELLEAVNALT